MQEYKFVSLADIRPDPDQPRKYNNADELKELSESIIQKGVLQPVLLRPANGKTPYKLVCGERRFKASLLAQVVKPDITSIPAIIREMTDEEALELQIIENLQRKDVHPLEEAFAFASLIKKKQLDVKEISARVGKSVGYVAQRIKLTELIKPFQDLLFAHRMPFAQAQEICRFSEHIQYDIYKEAKVPNQWATKEGWHLEKQSLWFISNHQHNLAQAAFKTEDPDLYPEMGKCGTCPYNSAANTLVFPDMPNKRICHNPGCYSIKTKRSYEQSIQQVLQQENILFVNNNYSTNDEAKGKIKSIEAAGHKVLQQEQVEILKAPEEIGSMEDVADHWKMKQAQTDEEKSMVYEMLVSNYNQKADEYEQLKSVAQKAFVVTGTGEGKIVDVILKSKNIKAGDVANPITAIDLELEAIAEKEKRAQELDREKVMKEVQSLMADKFTKRKSALMVLESLATIMAMITKASNETEARICELLGLKKANGYYLDKLAVWNALKQITTTKKDNYEWSETINEIHRRLLYDNLYSTTTLDYEKNWEPAVIFTLCDALEGTSQLTEAQAVKAFKRGTNQAKRIAELQAAKLKLNEEKLRKEHEKRARDAQRLAKKQETQTPPPVQEPAPKAGKKPIKPGFKAPASVDV